MVTDDLSEREERDALAVGQASAAEPGGLAGTRREARLELVDEAALADPGLPDDRDEAQDPLHQRPVVRLLQERQLALAADERPLWDRNLGLGAAPEHTPDAEGFGLVLHRHGLELLDLEPTPGGAIGGLADHDLARRGDALQPGRGVHHVTGDVLPDDRAGRERDHRLARVDPDPHVDVQRRVGLVQLGDRVERAERRRHRALRIVLVGDGCAEDAHHRVTDELVEGPAEPLDVLLDPAVERQKHAPHVLRVGAVRARREAHDVGEQHRDDAALLGGCRRPLARPDGHPTCGTEARGWRHELAARATRSCAELEAARHAEARDLRVRHPARRAQDLHQGAV